MNRSQDSYYYEYECFHRQDDRDGDNAADEEERHTAAGYEPMYPSLEEVEGVQVVSSGEAFRYAEEQQRKQNERLLQLQQRRNHDVQQHYESEPSRRFAPPSQQSQPRHHHTQQQQQLQDLSLLRHQPERRRSRDQHSNHRDKPAFVGSHPLPCVPTKHSLKPPPPSSSSSSSAIKGFDFLDRKPAAVFPPAATPGAVPVSHSPSGTSAWHTGGHGRAGPKPPPGSCFGANAASFPRLELEVGPGVYLPLHGSDETYYALRCGRLQAASCAVCEISLKCVSHAAHVLCPVCRVVSPVMNDNDVEDDDWGHREGMGGVGLGMSHQEYRRCLEELHMEEQRLERRIYL